MQKIKLPSTIDPISAAYKSLEYKGFYSSQQLIRVAESVETINSDIDVFISFETDEKQRVFIKGQSSVSLTLICQRCMNHFLYPVQSEYCFIPISHDAYEKLSETCRETYDFIELNELGELDLLSMIEDEIILSIPAFPVHEDKDCDSPLAKRMFCSLPEEVKKTNPFSVLSFLKKK